MKRILQFTVCLLITVLFTPAIVSAQDDAAELAKKLSNPIASLISVPLQNNTDYGIGSFEGTRNTMNIQPVLPVKLTEKINLIARWVQPVITQYNITGSGKKENGLGDGVVSAFISPSDSKNGFTWGAGPVFLVPVGTDDFLTTKKFGVGPTAVALKQSNGWTFGGLINQLFSVAGDDKRPDVNQMFFQPFVTYNWPSGAGLGANAEWTLNWEANTSTLWVNPTISAVTALGKQKVQFVTGPRFNADAPKNGQADFGWRAVVIFLFPK